MFLKQINIAHHMGEFDELSDEDEDEDESAEENEEDVYEEKLDLEGNGD